MKCRRINPDNGMVVWFGVKDVQKIDVSFTCGDDKIVGAPYKDDDISMEPCITVYSANPEYINKAVFQDENDKHANYASGKEAVVNSLTQRLSVLKKELWYDYGYGMPIVDKVRSKAVIDAYIIEKISEQPDVIDIEDFESRQDGNFYTCYIIVNSIYGQVELSL